ncbi:UDP-glucose 4-epimerase [Nocardia otitidiscaviarum]|uniref:NAD-dependent epimerase/dehydratase family protein n=1 Tax=Nocardia otitidiscaviarum TaxID=1823 RepID=UPI0005BAC65C|nr:NAD-dependent epimerase/dehydratase family protein [Nocardia otitidiscaviarum]MBF6135009.1 UDP-glucose 4-epimerase [Nocardia otitidiscaviarum]MBF6485388.1 UDP-glucose 4-epimerase [Nocardia otitidiscaviarum]
MRVLVTGAEGYVGRAVVAALRSSGYQPVAMVRGRPTSTSEAVRELPTECTDIRIAELLDAAAVREAVESVDAVCHLAGLGRARESLTDPLRYFRVNTGGTVTLLEAMADAGVRRIVLASTASIYGSPELQPMGEALPDAPPHPYASSKLAAELAVEAQASTGRLAAAVLRLSNIAGGADPDPTRLIPRTLAAALDGTPLTVNGDGTAVRDYLHVRDAAAAFVAALEQLPPQGSSRRYNIGSGKGSSVLDVAAAVERVTGRRVPLVHGPAVPEPRMLIIDPGRAVGELDWAPLASDLDALVQDCWAHRRK